jgi:hypothetical protein
MAAKMKVSVTIDRRVLRDAERLSAGATRSEIFERALSAWVQARSRAALDEAIEAYYRARGTEEVREDEEWSAAGDEIVRKGWSR